MPRNTAAPLAHSEPESTDLDNSTLVVSIDLASAESAALTVAKSEAEKVGNSEIIVLPSQVKAWLTSSVNSGKKITPWLRTASFTEMTALGLILLGEKNQEQRKLLNDLVRKVRKTDEGLFCEHDLSGVIVTFKDSGMTTTKKPVKKEATTEATPTPTTTEATTIAVPDFMTQFNEFLALMSQDELLQAQKMIADKLAA